MPLWLREEESRVFQRIAGAGRVFCFLDYDGTLSRLASTPDDATPLPGTAALLQELARTPGTQVAVISGRPVNNLRRFLNVPGIFYVGIHGLEIQLPNGEIDLAEGTAMLRSLLPGIKRSLQQSVGTRPGILLEDKGAALACHYRLASAPDAVTARQTVSNLARTYQRRGVRLSLTYGPEVAEIRPAYANKGKTVSALLTVHAPNALPIYIGDDRSDEDAFNQLPPHAVTIRVGNPDQPTRARYRVDDPEEVQRFVRAMLAVRMSGMAASASMQ